MSEIAALAVPRLLTVEEVAEALRLSTDQVYLIKHEIGFLRFGRAVRFDPASVRRYIDANRHGEAEKIRRLDLKTL